jgi:hypothetical protein
VAEPNYAGMTIEELDAASVALKAQQMAIREERRRILEIRTGLVFRRRLSQALQGIDIPEGLSDQEVVDLLAEARRTKRPGDVSVSPAPAELRAVPGNPEVGGAA